MDTILIVSKKIHATWDIFRRRLRRRRRPTLVVRIRGSSLRLFSRFERSRSSTTTTTTTRPSVVGARSLSVFVCLSLSTFFCVEVVPFVGEKGVVDTSSTRGGRHMSSAYFFAISTKSSTHLFGIKSNKLASILPPPSGTFTAFKSPSCLFRTRFPVFEYRRGHHVRQSSVHRSLRFHVLQKQMPPV